MITITKMNGNTRLTTQELAERLGVSIRNANRILKNLKTGGIATLVYKQSSISKGRPINIYELNF
nr:winged helix-turn-helix transcriptional regulator [[Clostridium] scindens]